jgi:glycosyltransferase involved in cell wall biosynthesis
MTIRVGLVCDLLEERWPSMDLVAEMLATHLPLVAPEMRVELWRPPMRARATRLPLAGGTRAAYSIDRYSNRYRDYPHWLSRHASSADVFHIVDHSYAHLVAVLPAGRTMVTCHDIDAFRCLTQPNGGGLYRVVARRVLAGLRAAALVTCDTRATRDDLIGNRLADPSRLEVVPNGVHPVFGSPIAPRDREEAGRLLGPTGLELLHVGSVIPRKRIDLLLQVLARVRKAHSAARLVRVGGAMIAEQRAIARSLGLEGAVVELPFLTREVLAAVYERAALTLLPSDLEGFGLPVLESLACGTPAVASRIPALVEVGGDSASFAPRGDAEAWTETVVGLLRERESDAVAWRARRERGRARAAQFTWDGYARSMARIYAGIARARRAEDVAAASSA